MEKKNFLKGKQNDLIGNRKLIVIRKVNRLEKAGMVEVFKWMDGKNKCNGVGWLVERLKGKDKVALFERLGGKN